MKYYTVAIILILTTIIMTTVAYPRNQRESANNLIDDEDVKYGRLKKKSAFMSRGWAAGGMPFSVLYLKPDGQSKLITQAAHSKDRAIMDMNDLREPKKPEYYKQPHAATGSSTPKTSKTSLLRKSYSVIPQLFVSYGWGPLGQ